MILGITRSKVFSPNMEDKDMAIMRAVKSHLNVLGHQVRLVEEQDWMNEQTDDNLPDAIFTMMRSSEALEKLKRIEEIGVPTLNCANGILHAHRVFITRLMRTHGIPIPKTILFPEESPDNIYFPCWVKNGGGWAQGKDDVMLVRDCQEFNCQVTRLREKYPDETVVVAEHLEGDLVKFYGVAGTDFFYWSYPDPLKSKFGLEKINGAPNHTPFDKNGLIAVCDKVAQLSQIVVYGGDCIVDRKGNFNIIDFNDWPSFSSCRQQAAEAIAGLLLKFLIHHS